MSKVYHLGLDEGKIEEARFAFLPGDPDRVKFIAQNFDSNSKEIAYKREYRSYLGKMKGKSVLVTSTGIGGPSTSIAVEELAQLGVKIFIRIGTTGAIQKNIKLADVIIVTGSVRLDGASTHYAPVEYPAVADYEVLDALVEAAKALGLRHHIGITASCDTFYPGQERKDSYSGYIIRRFQGSMKEWQRLNVLNYEMESSTLLTMANAMRLKAGCVMGVIVNRTESEEINPKVVEKAEINAVSVAIEAMKTLILQK